MSKGGVEDAQLRTTASSMPGIFAVLGDLRTAELHDLDNLGDNKPHATLVYTGDAVPEAKLQDAIHKNNLNGVLRGQTVTFERTAEIDRVNRDHEDFTRYYVTAKMDEKWLAIWTGHQEPFTVGAWEDYSTCNPGHTTLGWYKSRQEAEARKALYDAACRSKVYSLQITEFYM